MPRLLPATKKLRQKRFLEALERTGSPGKAAMEVANIGSKGGKNLEASAASTGSQILSRIKLSMVEALEKKGVTADKVAGHVVDLLDSQDPMWIDKGIDKAAKFGVGGGYVADKHVNMNINAEVEAQPEIKQLTEKLNAVYRSASGRSDGMESGALDNKASDKE